MLRLAQPAFPLFVFYVVVVGGATLIGVDPKLLGPVVLGAGSPLWFLAAYGLCQAVVPFAVHWHLRAPKRTLLVLLIGAIQIVDVARYSTDNAACGAAQPVLRLGAHSAARQATTRFHIAGMDDMLCFALWPMRAGGSCWTGCTRGTARRLANCARGWT